jgi:hypothetical protein
MIYTPLLRARKLSTLPHPSPFITSEASLGSWVATAGVMLATAAILLVPSHEFDDLDCQSYVERYCVSGGKVDDEF